MRRLFALALIISVMLSGCAGQDHLTTAVEDDESLGVIETSPTQSSMPAPARKPPAVTEPEKMPPLAAKQHHFFADALKGNNSVRLNFTLPEGAGCRLIAEVVANHTAGIFHYVLIETAAGDGSSTGGGFPAFQAHGLGYDSRNSTDDGVRSHFSLGLSLITGGVAVTSVATNMNRGLNEVDRDVLDFDHQFALVLDCQGLIDAPTVAAGEGSLIEHAATGQGGFGASAAMVHLSLDDVFEATFSTPEVRFLVNQSTGTGSLDIDGPDGHHHYEIQGPGLSIHGSPGFYAIRLRYAGLDPFVLVVATLGSYDSWAEAVDALTAPSPSA